MDSAPEIWDNLVLLVKTLLALVLQLGSLGVHWILWIAFAAVCLFAINWHKARHFLRVGGWAPAVLLIFLVAFVWSRIVPLTTTYWGMPNFFFQLVYVSILAGIAMFCGWIQTVMHWTPHDINFDPPAHGHGHGHDHGHGHAHH